MLSLEVTPSQEEYLPNQAMRLNVVIRNEGAEAVELADPEDSSAEQPAYGFMGPEYPSGKMTSRAAWTREQSGSEAPLPEPARIRIEPGGAWEGAVPVRALLPLSTPGDYRVRAMLAFQDKRAVSPEKRLRVVAPRRPVSVHLGQGSRPLEIGEGEAMFLAKEDAATAVYVSRFSEKHPGIGEMGANAPIRRFAAGPKATDAGVPWTDAPFFAEMIRWVVWREGRNVEALANIASAPVSFALPFEPARLVRPPLHPAGGGLEVLALAADHKELAMVQFDDPDVAPKLAWRMTLPAAAVAITTFPGAHRYIAFAAKNDGGFDVYLSHYAAGGPPAPFQRVHIPEGAPLGAEPMAIAVEGGKVEVAVAAIGPGGNCLLAQTWFDASGKPSDPPKVVTFEGLEHRPVDAAVLLAASDGKIARREVAVTLEDKTVWRLGGANGASEISIPGEAAHPLELAPGARVSYVLFFDPARGLRFEKLPN